MLNIKFGEITEDCIVKVDSYFNIAKTKDWFNSSLVKSIIKEIDKSDAIKDEYIESPVFGAISPDRLSTGCKATILLAVLDKPHVYGTKCGDNCIPKILEIAANKDITITLHHHMIFPETFVAYLPEIRKVIYSRKEFDYEYYEFRRSIRK